MKGNLTLSHIVLGFGGAAVALVLAAQAANSQEAWSGSGSSSRSSAYVKTQSGAYASQQIILAQRSPNQVRSETVHSGTYTLKTAPAVQPPSMGSGHPCGLGTSIGLSIIGGGAGGGTTKVDEACLLAQMGQGEAALIMIAQRDENACKALRQVGRIAADSVCGAEEKRALATRQKAPPPNKVSNVGEYIKCSRNKEGTLVAKHVKANAPFSHEQIADYCRSVM